MDRSVGLATLDLPKFGLPSVEPVLDADIYRNRLRKVYDRVNESNYDIFVVYGDREHFANLTYLTGFDPRFEEALLLLNIRDESQKPTLLVGNEGFGYANVSPIRDDLEVVLYQSFSLLGQDRTRSRKLADILKDVGIGQGKRVGVAGWKYFDKLETDTPKVWLEIPAYIVDTLRELVGDVTLVENAGAIFMDSQHGLRSINEVAQLARFEYAATYASQAIRNAIFSLKPGMTELEAVEQMRLNGLPLSCHIMCSSGKRAFLGLASPSTKTIERGDPYSNVCGVWGALTCRAGFVVESANELPSDIQDYVEKLVAPYFSAVVEWYEHVGIGVTGGEMYDLVHDRIGDPFFGVKLNPGHLIHLDEWVNSPIYAGSMEILQSGMAIQVDIIPATGTPYFTTNIEDGIALADEPLRAQFADQYPEAWGRIEKRRAFMQDVLGIALKPEVLPFSNIPAYLPPYLLSPNQAMRVL